MKFLLDESAEFRLATFLEGEGHDAKTIAHDFQHSLSDEEVLAIALREQRILITNDRDFGELIVRRRLGVANPSPNASCHRRADSSNAIYKTVSCPVDSA